LNNGNISSEQTPEPGTVQEPEPTPDTGESDTNSNNSTALTCEASQILNEAGDTCVDLVSEPEPTPELEKTLEETPASDTDPVVEALSESAEQVPEPEPTQESEPTPTPTPELTVTE
jgi:hypothetical protein